jgi:hypothetical protein
MTGCLLFIVFTTFKIDPFEFRYGDLTPFWLILPDDLTPFLISPHGGKNLVLLRVFLPLGGDAAKRQRGPITENESYSERQRGSGP